MVEPSAESCAQHVALAEVCATRIAAEMNAVLSGATPVVIERCIQANSKKLALDIRFCSLSIGASFGQCWRAAVEIEQVVGQLPHAWPMHLLAAPELVDHEVDVLTYSGIDLGEQRRPSDIPPFEECPRD